MTTFFELRDPASELRGAAYIRGASAPDDIYPDVVLQISETDPLDEPVWLDVTDAEDTDGVAHPRLVDFDPYCGRSSELTDFAPGTGPITIDNRDGTFDRDNPDSVLAAYLTTNRRIRIVATLNGTATTVLDRFVDFWPMDDDPTFEARAITVTTTDTLGLLAERDITPARPFILDDPEYGQLDSDNLLTGAASFAAQLAGARIADILELIGVPDSLMDIDDGVTQVVADAPTDKVVPYLQRLARSELGKLYCPLDNVVTFRDRRADSRIGEHRTHQALFSDKPTGTGLPYEFVVVDPGTKSLIKNVVTRATATKTFTAIDLNSRQQFGALEDRETDLLTADFNVLVGTVEYVVSRYKDGVVRVTAITINWLASPDLFALMLAVDIGWMIRIGRTPRIGGTVVLRDCNVESIEHHATAPFQWSTTWGLLEADPTPYFTLNDPVLGKLDSGNQLAF